MNTIRFGFLVVGPILVCACSALAEVRYVDMNSFKPMPPYTNWATAATNIQDAVDVGLAGDEIMVANGIYANGGRDGYRVAVSKPLALRSVNGPQSTIVDASLMNLSCVYLTNGASLSGFTLTQGRAYLGGGVFCESATAVVSNCVITGNEVIEAGAGGGAYGGTLDNCTLSGNYAMDTPVDCRNGCSAGGGVSGATLNNCTLIGNYAKHGGGASDCTLNNCTLIGNSGDGGGAKGCTLNNCTVSGNSGGGAYASTLNNCIVYFNSSPQDANYDSTSTLNYCCTTPLPTNGVGNITTDPRFVDTNGWANLRLQSNSPCISTGNNAYVVGAADLDGFPRIKGGTVDIGAYEFPILHYVDLDSANPTPPYPDWAKAATSIQDAVNTAAPGDEIVVTDGIYGPVTVDKPLSVESVNGARSTTIDAKHQGQCASLTNGVSVSGFTLTNGFAHGYGGGVRGGTLNYCTLTGNVVFTLSPRRSGDSFGGGAAFCTLNNCTLAYNSAIASDGSPYPPLFAAGGGAYGCTLNNCALIGNWARANQVGAASGGGVAFCTLNNCTLTGNSADDGGGASDSTLNNCIVHYNMGFGEVVNNYDSYSLLNYSCTAPLPTNGVGNITNAPLFVETNGWANLRLQPTSPCINSGNDAYVVGGTDLDGNPRIIGRTVDMGAYEFQAAVHYVDSNNSNPTPPYTSWATAAVGIQEALDAAAAGDGILVTNGSYSVGARTVDGITSNRVAVSKGLSLGSINGPQGTTIEGGGSVRCVYLADGARLSGFTLTNGGAPFGGGVWCESTNAVVSDCVLSGSSAWCGGGAFGGTLLRCTLTRNTSVFMLLDTPSPTGGGGAYGSTLNNCTLIENSAQSWSARMRGPAQGGGASTCTLNNCSVISNSAVGQISNAGLGGGAIDSTLNNCALIGNLADGPGLNGLGGAALNCLLNNCTVASNRAAGAGAGADGGTLNNCISFNNTVPAGCEDCGTPGRLDGANNWVGEPRFMDLPGGNLRLQTNSPCINAGLNAMAPAGPDLDGHLRIVGGTVDIGAYEFPTPSSAISYAWLQQYGLPTDGSADFTDADGDGMNNWQEWRCGTDPTNALSVLRLLAPVNAETNVTVTWQSVAGVSYLLERSTNLALPYAFSALATNIPGQPGTTTYMDTNAAAWSGPWFYRVGVGD